MRGVTQVIDHGASRADLHCHSTASQVSKLGVQRALGLPECATPPEEAYELAKRRGMDFVTLTDHDVIDGAVELASAHADAFVSVELTAGFAGEPQAVHVLCWGITPEQFEVLRAAAADVEDVAAYLADEQIAAALAHPFYAVEAPLLPRHRRRLAQLFGVWETRNGSRAPELNSPAAVYIDTHGGTGTGGSDDHAGVDIGRTWTRTPAAPDWRAFLEHVRHGRAEACGRQGSAAKWAHAAMAIATRVLGGDEAPVGRSGARAGRGPAHVRADHARGRRADGRAGLGPRPGGRPRPAARLAGGGGPRPAGRRPARAPAGRRLLALRPPAPRPHRPRAQAAPRGRAGRRRPAGPGRRPRGVRRVRRRRPLRAARPPSWAGRRPSSRSGRASRCASRSSRTASAPCRRDAHPRGDPRARRPRLRGGGRRNRHGGRPAPVRGRRGRGAVLRRPADRRPVAARGGRRAGRGPLRRRPPVFARADRRGRRAWSRGSWACRSSAPTTRSSRRTRPCGPRTRWSPPASRRCCGPSTASATGSCRPRRPPTRRWRGSASRREGSGAGTAASTPPASAATCGPAAPGDGRVDVLYAGRLAREKGVDLLAEAFELARLRDPRLRLVLAGGGPDEEPLRRRLGAEHARFLGWLDRDALAVAYASADVFCFCSPDRHVRAGRAGGPGVGPAGRRGRRGRPGGARGGRPVRGPVPAVGGRGGRRARVPRGIARGARPAGPRRLRGGRGADLGPGDGAARRGLPERARRASRWRRGGRARRRLPPRACAGRDAGRGARRAA